MEDLTNALDEYNVRAEKEAKLNGPTVKELESSLDLINVDRLAYHSGVFVGNHVALFLSEWGVEAITSALLKIKSETHSKYFIAFTIISKIFKLTSAARFLSGVEVDTLCQLCTKFGQFYSDKFVAVDDPENQHSIFNKVSNNEHMQITS